MVLFSRPSCSVLLWCISFETNDHFGCFGFKSGRDKKDKSIWKIKMQTALASLSALITAIDNTNLLASFFIFLLKLVNLAIPASALESPFRLLSED
ncbi:hypothetical protein H5410_008439 [Solanum commersonii]|uniref:Uncharacterized protein n=1 Tax=Solanum commersonii TaxID=4109 RepID=A0A9J6AEY9_SOLCO|nr:hypothetical protein H5410_008439 [Solanum commersonii]